MRQAPECDPAASKALPKDTDPRESMAVTTGTPQSQSALKDPMLSWHVAGDTPCNPYGGADAR